jgi:hypothetical protein
MVVKKNKNIVSSSSSNQHQSNRSLTFVSCSNHSEDYDKKSHTADTFNGTQPKTDLGTTRSSYYIATTIAVDDLHDQSYADHRGGRGDLMNCFDEETSSWAIRQTQEYPNRQREQQESYYGRNMNVTASTMTAGDHDHGGGAVVGSDYSLDDIMKTIASSTGNGGDCDHVANKVCNKRDDEREQEQQESHLISFPFSSSSCSQGNNPTTRKTMECCEEAAKGEMTGRPSSFSSFPHQQEKEYDEYYENRLHDRPQMTATPARTTTATTTRDFSSSYSSSSDLEEEGVAETRTSSATTSNAATNTTPTPSNSRTDCCLSSITREEQLLNPHMDVIAKMIHEVEGYLDDLYDIQIKNAVLMDDLVMAGANL